MTDLNERAREVHAANAKLWHEPETGEPLERNKGAMLMDCVAAVVTEGADVAYDRLLDFAAGFNIPISDVTTGDVAVDADVGESKLLLCAHIINVYWILQVEEMADDLGDVLSVAIGALAQFCKRFGPDLDPKYAKAT